MKRLVPCAMALAFVVFAAVAGFGDAQYTEQTKITGGAMAGAMKFVGVFSKDAKQATQGTTTTISVKGNKMRRESSLGTAEIYDLDGRKFISLDLKHKTYSVMTFDELRQQMAEARRKAAEQQAKSHKGSDTQVKITPKIQVTPGTGSKTILGHSAKEVKSRIDMQVEAQDARQKSESGNMWVNADTYVAPVKAYEDVKRFYVRMAKELDWVPGEAFGSSGNVQISQPMVEYNKSLNSLTGMPLLSYVSVGSGPNPGTTGQAAAQATPEKKEGNVVTRGIGGVFHKKQKDDSSQQAGGAGGSLMDMTTEVTSITPGAVDAGLFTIPEGFKQVEAKKSH
ncbi:MAG TPA: hypothetical protein VKW06_15410 [Candidatus Angelobacter sp.]|nr:hypothetical protein [Candidatus Angelobacter sp.]